MADLDQEIMIFHSGVVFTKHMRKPESMVFLFVKSFVFNLPAATPIQNKLFAISPSNAHVCNKNKRIFHIALYIFGNIQLVGLVRYICDIPVCFRYFALDSL